MPNAENINKVINWIKEDGGRHYRMANYCQILDETGRVVNDNPSEYVDCKTAYCIGGTANLIRMQEAGENPKLVTGIDFSAQFNNDPEAAKWLGVSYDTGINLFLMFKAERTGLGAFDALPIKTRCAAAINVLERLRDTGIVDWDLAVDEAKALSQIEEPALAGDDETAQNSADA